MSNAPANLLRLKHLELEPGVQLPFLRVPFKLTGLRPVDDTSGSYPSGEIRRQRYGRHFPKGHKWRTAVGSMAAWTFAVFKQRLQPLKQSSGICGMISPSGRCLHPCIRFFIAFVPLWTLNRVLVWPSGTSKVSSVSVTRPLPTIVRKEFTGELRGQDPWRPPGLLQRLL